MSFARTGCRFLVLTIVVTFLGPLLILCKRLLPLKIMPYNAIQRLLYKWLRQAMSVKKLHIVGVPETYRPLVMVVNHISYMDILILGSYLDCIFVSKDDVRSWPIIGWIAEQYGTLFISRDSKNVKQGIKKLHNALKKEKPVIFFPESTTSDGCQVLNFKSSYFELPEGTKVQPVSLRYSQINGLPATRFIQKRLSWRGSEDLFRHLKQAINFRCVFVTITFHPALSCGTSSRKELAKACHHLVLKGFEIA